MGDEPASPQPPVYDPGFDVVVTSTAEVVNSPTEAEPLADGEVRDPETGFVRQKGPRDVTGEKSALDPSVEPVDYDLTPTPDDRRLQAPDEAVYVNPTTGLTKVDVNLAADHVPDPPKDWKGDTYRREEPPDVLEALRDAIKEEEERRRESEDIPV